MPSDKWVRDQDRCSSSNCCWVGFAEIGLSSLDILFPEVHKEHGTCAVMSIGEIAEWNSAWADVSGAAATSWSEMRVRSKASTLAGTAWERR